MEAFQRVADEVAYYSDVLTGSRLAQFLATESWTIQQDLGYEQVWIHPELQRDRPVYLHLPRNPRLDDYGRRFAQAVEVLSRVYGMKVGDVAEKVAAIHADLFFVRVKQSSMDGTIPFRQASALLESIDQMIRSAALVAYSPQSTGKGRMPGAVTEFLEEDVRMGHTKKGSFIITVAARIEKAGDTPPEFRPDPVYSLEPFDARGPFDVRDLSESVQLQQLSAEPQYIPSYTRQVMTTLSRSLSVTKEVLRDDTTGPAFESAVFQGMRLPMVQALHSIGEADGVRGIDLNFEWSPVETMQEPVESSIEMNREQLHSLETIELRLKDRVEPRQETIVGPVIECKWSNDSVSGDASEGEVVVRADVDGRLRKVTVPLVGSDYDWAIRAHRAKLTFTVSGELGKRGNAWRLSPPIVVDTGFLEYSFNRSTPVADGGADE